MTIYGKREVYTNCFKWRYSLKYGGNDLSAPSLYAFILGTVHKVHRRQQKEIHDQLKSMK